MASKKSRKVHVTYGDSKRIISYQKGAEVKQLRHLFLSEFSDVLADDISPANVKFQVFDSTFKDYVDLKHDHHLEENAQIKAITVGTKEKQVCSNFHAEARCWYFYPSYAMLACCSETGPPSFPPDLKPHTIKKDVRYRFWNPVSNGLMQRQVSQRVTCNGGFASSDTIIVAKSVGDNEFHLVYNGDGPVDGYLYITSKGEGQEVIVSSTATADSVFIPDYYWGQTVFKSKPYSTLYLGSDGKTDATCTLVTMEDSHYPNPQALFIVNKYNPTPPIPEEI